MGLGGSGQPSSSAALFVLGFGSTAVPGPALADFLDFGSFSCQLKNVRRGALIQAEAEVFESCQQRFQRADPTFAFATQEYAGRAADAQSHRSAVLSCGSVVEEQQGTGIARGQGEHFRFAAMDVARER